MKINSVNLELIERLGRVRESIGTLPSSLKTNFPDGSESYHEDVEHHCNQLQASLDKLVGEFVLTEKIEPVIIALTIGSGEIPLL